MIRQTVDRLDGLVTPEQTLIVTNERLVDTIQAQLPELPPTSIVGEPCRRDTAPCIGLAALLVSRDDPDATMAVMPADHVISPTAKFQAAIMQAADMVDRAPGQIVTFGIKPNYPAEIFGYIQRGESTSTGESASADGAAPTYTVKEFREKPDAATAAKYLDSGDYYWNSGIFIWKAKTILEALAKRQAKMLGHLEKIVADWGTEKQAKNADHRVHRDRRHLGRLRRRHGTRHRRRRDRSPLQLGRPGRLAILGATARHRTTTETRSSASTSASTRPAPSSAATTSTSS